MAIKEYIIAGKEVIITDEKGMRPAVPFTNNFIKIEIVKSVISFLEGQLENDSKDLEKKKSERAWRLSDYKKHTLLSTGASLVVSPVVGALFGLHNQQTNTMFGEANGLIGFSISMIPAMIVASQLLVSYGLVLRPSKKTLNGKDEKIKYERELLEEWNALLLDLLSDRNMDELENYDQTKIGTIDDSEDIKYIKDSIGLRYMFGAQFKQVMKVYHTGELYQCLVDSNICEKAIDEFIEFIDSYEHDVNLDKKMQKGIC